MSNSSVFNILVNVLRGLQDLPVYDREFQTEGALTLKVSADKAKKCPSNKQIVILIFCTWIHILSNVVNFTLNIKCIHFKVFVVYCFYRAMHYSAKRGLAIACRLSVCL